MNMNEYDIELEVKEIHIDRSNEITKIDIEIKELSKEITVSVPNTIKSGDCLKLKGLGRPKSDGTKGDVYIMFLKVIEVSKMNEKKYKYKYINSIQDFELEDELNEYGEEGWKCISVLPIIKTIQPTIPMSDGVEMEPNYEYNIVLEKENLDSK
ncbi:MAG: hypothetical protein HFJ02_01950 [Bacilli bacterium]|nr:hypothetical protein [Bacilli bacterium]